MPLWKQEITDQFERVSTDEAISMAFRLARLAREEGVFAGTSTGANVTATLRLAGKLSPNATIVAVICDAAMKYLKNYSAAINA